MEFSMSFNWELIKNDDTTAYCATRCMLQYSAGRCYLITDNWVGGFDSNSRKQKCIIIISSLWYRGKARRAVRVGSPFDTLFIQISARSGEQSVLTLDSLYLPYYKKAEKKSPFWNIVHYLSPSLKEEIIYLPKIWSGQSVEANTVTKLYLILIYWNYSTFDSNYS